MTLARGALAGVLLAVLAPTLAISEDSRPAVLRGAVKQELVLDETLLRSLPVVTIDVSFETSQGQKSGNFTGVLLWALLEKAGTIDAPGKNARLRHTLLATGRDGYAAALALGEIDPHYEGKQAILAYAGGEPPATFASLRLVVPGDAHGGRSVRDLGASKYAS